MDSPFDTADLPVREGERHGRASGPRAFEGLRETATFGANPGALRMLTYVPTTLVKNPALVVVLHGCTQTAESYDRGAGWSKLAGRGGFVLLYPEQRRSNNNLRRLDHVFEFQTFDQIAVIGKVLLFAANHLFQITAGGLQISFGSA